MEVLRATFPVPGDVQAAMANAVAEINFDFLDPVEQLARLLVCSPLAADKANICLAPEKPSEYIDFCHGERWRRINSSLSNGDTPSLVLFASTRFTKTKSSSCLEKQP